MATYKHADKQGNITVREHGTIYPSVASPQATIDPYDPFAKYAGAFEPVKMEYAPGVPVVESAPVAQVDPSLERYNNFLRDQFINPNQIGLATIDRNSGQMLVPTAAQQYEAVNANNRANAYEGDLARAADIGWQQKNPSGAQFAMSARKEQRDLNARRGRTYEDRIKYYMGQIYNTPPSNPSNGFSG